MAERELRDGSIEFLAGQDASRSPDKIAPNAYASGINFTTQNGDLSPRYGFQEIILTYPEGSFTLPTGATRSYESIFREGKFQALIPYSVDSEFFLIAVISGIIFSINQRTFEVSVINIADGSYLDESKDRINWSPGGRFLVIFDFPAYPVIIEDFVARRADPADLEIPRSNIGTYNQNRLLIGNIGNEWTAGDPAAYGFPDGPITFNEVLQPASPYFGQFFQLSTNYNNDPITAMGFLQVIDKSTGIGPALISTQNQVYSYHTEIARNQWEASQFGSIFINNTGIVGQRAFDNINSDLMFVSSDGQFRSASMSRDDQGKWARTPISREVQNFLNTFDSSLTKFSFVSYYKNKVFFACNPYRVLATSTDYDQVFDYCFGGLLVLELDNISGLGKASPPAWAGLWTGVRPMDMTINNQQAFIMSKDGGINSLYRVREDLTYDLIGKEQTIRKIKSKVYTREYSFETEFYNKTLNDIIFNLQNIKGEFKIKVSYKPSHGSDFILWREFYHNAPWRSCGIPEGCEWFGLKGQQFRDFNLGTPEESGCDPIENWKYTTFKKVQLLIEVEGVDWTIEGFNLVAVIAEENTTKAICATNNDVKICGTCNTDWEIPDICQEKQQTLL